MISLLSNLAWLYRHPMTPGEDVLRCRRAAAQLRAEASLVGAPLHAIRAASGPHVWSGARARRFLDELEDQLRRIDSSPTASVQAQLVEAARRLDARADAAQAWLDAASPGIGS